MVKTKIKATVPVAMTMLAAFFLGIFRADAATPEQGFWTWFQKNDAALFDFEHDQGRVFDRLAKEMHKINPNLTFEFGPKKDGQREFVISADGIKTAFPAVEALYATAPPLPHWKVIRFRPRREPADISYNNVSVKASSVRVHMEINGRIADLTVFIPGYTAENRDSYTAINYLLLDQALGEFDVETYVGQIRVESSPGIGQKTYSLAELPAAFDSLIKARHLQ